MSTQIHGYEMPKTLLCGCREDRPCEAHIAPPEVAPRLNSLSERSSVEYVSLKCANDNCDARLGYNFAEDEDEMKAMDYARHQNGWAYGQDGLMCDRCSRESTKRAKVIR